MAAPRERIGGRAIAILGGLLGLAGCAASAPAARPLTGSLSTEVAGYADSDHVSVVTPSVSGAVGSEQGGWSVGGSYLVDVVTAASVDIVATASPPWREVRQAGALHASLKRGPVTVGVHGNLSSEPDYLSLGGGATASVELLDKNLVPFFGASYGHDDVGRSGQPRTAWRLLQRGHLLAGATFVLHRRVIASLQLDGQLEGGYLAKPYRYVPLFAPGTGEAIPAGATPAQVNAARLDERPADAVPDQRDRFALSGRLAARLPPCTLRLDERLYVDTWGLWASTTDLRLFVDVGSRLLLGPHLRLHVQGPASFWRRAYEAIDDGGTRSLPAYRTGDRELSPLQTVTLAALAKVRLSRPEATAVFLSLQAAAVYSHYDDALYITQRWALLSSLSLAAEWR